MPDTLAAWTPNGNTALTGIDFGTVLAGSSADVSFRVKNQSVTYTAVNASVTVTGASAGQYYLSADGRTYTASLTIGDIHASAITGLIYLRRVTPASASAGAYSCQLALAALTWTA